MLEELRASGELPDVLAALEAGDSARALELLVDGIADAPAEERIRRRDLAVAVFDDLGQEDPIATAYRRRLASALY